MHALPPAEGPHLPAYEVLRRAISLLAEIVEPGPGPGGPHGRGAGRPRDENAPVVEGGDGTRGLRRVVELVRDAALAHQAGLCRLDDEADGLTLVASLSDAMSGPLHAPRHAYPQLRALLAAGELALLPREPEATLLTQALRLPSTLPVLVVPIPPPSGHLRLGEDGPLWGLLVFGGELAQTLGESDYAHYAPSQSSEQAELLSAAAQLLELTLRSSGLDETLRDRTRRMRISDLRRDRQPPPPSSTTASSSSRPPTASSSSTSRPASCG